MTHLLSPQGLSTLREVVQRGAVLAFDFDGTLAPIVDDRRDAQLTSLTRSLLHAVAVAFPCAVVSGRARADVASRLEGIPLRAIAGNHGAEVTDGGPPPQLRARVLAWAAALDTAAIAGIDVEDKVFSLAVHVRRAPRPAEALARVLRLAATLPEARAFGGIEVVNVVAVGAPTKGDAVAAFAAGFPGAPVLYVGDDVTDEDAFRSPAVTWGVRVGASADTAARYHLEGQTEVDGLLRALALEHARHR